MLSVLVTFLLLWRETRTRTFIGKRVSWGLGYGLRGLTHDPHDREMAAGRHEVGAVAERGAF